MNPPFRTSRTARALVALLTVAAIPAALLGLFCCGGSGAEVHADEAPVYDVVLPSASVKAGEAAKAPIEIKARSGWKWNAEFPARFSVSATGPVEVSPAELSSGEGNLEVAEKSATVPLQVKGKAAGKGEVVVKANFSICSDESCKVFRNRELRFAVDVK